MKNPAKTDGNRSAGLVKRDNQNITHQNEWRNTENERILLGCYAQNAPVGPDIGEALFSSAINRTIFKVIAELRSAGHIVDLTIMCSELGRLKKLDYCGGCDAIAELTNGAMPSNVSYYEERLIESFNLRRLHETACRTKEAIENGATPEEIQDNLYVGSRKTKKPIKTNTDNRKIIMISEIKELHIMSQLTWEGIVKAGRPVYQTDGIPERVKKTEYGAKIEPLTQDSLRHEASQSNCYLKTKSVAEDKTYFVEVPPPVDVIKDALASTNIPLPTIKGIISHPTIAENGKIVCRAGYNPDTCLYIDTNEEILRSVENIPAAPTASEISEAVGLIDEVITDFPFIGSADRAGYFSMMLTMLCLPIIRGSIPIFIIQAPAPGTGKSLLAESSVKIVTGRSPAPTPWAENEEELKKSIHSLLLSGSEYIFIDNVNTKIKSGTLAAVITSRQLNSRVLGFSKMASVPCNAVIILTANNPDLSREIARRCVPIGLASNFENPSERSGFKHPDLDQFIMENRQGLLRAGLTMARAWFADECDTTGVKVLASFENWSKTIGGMLKSCGINGFLENTGEFFSLADGEAENITAFVKAWYNEKGHFPVLVKDILLLAKEHGLVNEKYPENSQKKALGHFLRRKQDIVFAGIKITRSGLSAGNMTWKAVKVEEVS